MKCLSIQILPEFIADFDRADFLHRVRRLGRAPEVDHFSDGGKAHLSFHFFTEMPAALWRDLHHHLYLDDSYGPKLNPISVVTCENPDDESDFLVLHHPDPTEKIDSL